MQADRFPEIPDQEPAETPVSAPASRPDVTRLREVMEGPLGVRSLSLTGIFFLGTFYTLYLGRSFFLPLVLALLFSLLLSPFVRSLKRLHIPEPLGAGLVLLALLAALGLGIYQLGGPAYDWMHTAPQSLGRVETKLRALRKQVQTLGRATEQVEKMATVAGTGAKAPAIAVQSSSLPERLFGQVADVAWSAFIMFVLLYFLLASGDMFLRKLIKVLPRLEDKRRAVEMARQVEHDVSTYLATVTMINISLGIAVWISMGLIGLPNPLLWGVMVTVTNFVPYLGAATCYIVLTMVGFLTFDSIGHCLLPPAIFLVLNVTEAYLVTPLILGRRLTLNPVVLFVGLTFWGWLWGVPGALLAVPIMVVCKIFCERIEPLAPIGEFLGS